MIERATIIALSLALMAPWPGALAQERDALLPSIPRAAGERCVEPTDVMRREHMRFLMHQRDETVHDGIRSAKHSLTGCVDCHAGKDARGVAVAVNARGQFCESCHSFAGVRIDCFECHATVPAGSRARAALDAPVRLRAALAASVEAR